jgi:hypothetical protein
MKKKYDHFYQKFRDPGHFLGTCLIYITQFQVLLLISDLKLGHYMKVIF